MLDSVKHIGIDGYEANIERRVGSNVYAFELLKALEELTRKRTDVEFTIFLTAEPISELPSERAGWKYQLIKPRKFATQWALPLALFRRRKELDLFFTPGHYAPRISAVPYISSVMDLAYLKYPEQFKKRDLFQLTEWTKYSVKRAKHVVTISESSKQDIIRYYKKDEEDISVIYPALGGEVQQKISKKKKKDTMQRFGLREGFILYIGTIQPRKNLVRLIQAYQQYRDSLKKSDPAPQLVISGKIGWLSGEVIRAVERSPYKQDIKLTGFISDVEKSIFYQLASCTVLVGLYEGFGIPPLESLTHRTIPVVSETSSLPEVIGEAGVQVNPEDVNDIAQGIEYAVNLNDKERKHFEKLADAQVKKFSWQKGARELLELLESQ